MSTSSVVTALSARDYPRWVELWRAYLAFYETELPHATYQATWKRILTPGPIYGLGARDDDGTLVGITHYLFHAHGWTHLDACYLQDLYVDDAARGKGYAKLLIAGVADAARARGLSRMYWLTHESNATARRLYDRVAENHGFIRYEYPL